MRQNAFAEHAPALEVFVCFGGAIQRELAVDHGRTHGAALEHIEQAGEVSAAAHGCSEQIELTEIEAADVHCGGLCGVGSEYDEPAAGTQRANGFAPAADWVEDEVEAGIVWRHLTGVLGPSRFVVQHAVAGSRGN